MSLLVVVSSRHARSVRRFRMFRDLAGSLSHLDNTVTLERVAAGRAGWWKRSTRNLLIRGILEVINMFQANPTRICYIPQGSLLILLVLLRQLLVFLVFLLWNFSRDLSREVGFAFRRRRIIIGLRELRLFLELIASRLLHVPLLVVSLVGITFSFCGVEVCDRTHLRMGRRGSKARRRTDPWVYGGRVADSCLSCCTDGLNSDHHYLWTRWKIKRNVQGMQNANSKRREYTGFTIESYNSSFDGGTWEFGYT